MARAIELELLPHERAALLKWNHTPEVRDQLEALRIKRGYRDDHNYLNRCSLAGQRPDPHHRQAWLSRPRRHRPQRASRLRGAVG